MRGRAKNAPQRESRAQRRIGQVRSLLTQQANVNYSEPRRFNMTPLHHALETGGSISTVNLLLRARADPNAPMSTGQMPLQMALQRFMGIPPTTIRMLVCYKARRA